MPVPSSLTVRSPRTLPRLPRVPRYPGGWGAAGTRSFRPPSSQPQALPPPPASLLLCLRSFSSRCRRPVALTHHPLGGQEQPLTSQSYSAPPRVDSDLTRAEAYFVFFWRDIAFFPATQGCQSQDTIHIFECALDSQHYPFNLFVSLTAVHLNSLSMILKSPDALLKPISERHTTGSSATIYKVCLTQIL